MTRTEGQSSRGNRRPPRRLGDRLSRTCLVKPAGCGWKHWSQKINPTQEQVLLYNRVRVSLRSWASWGSAKLNWERKVLLTFRFIHGLKEFVTMCKTPLRQTKICFTQQHRPHCLEYVCALGQVYILGMTSRLCCSSPTSDSKGVIQDLIPVIVSVGETLFNMF